MFLSKERLEALRIRVAEVGLKPLGAILSHDELADLFETAQSAHDPIPITLWCPNCGGRHIDEGEFATKSHHTHSCQICGLTWRPAIQPTVGVQHLPGFKNREAK